MRIVRFEVDGFLDRAIPIKYELNPDINIITGFNGSGKTNLLKLLWYTISGNINILLQEVSFGTLTLETDIYSIRITKVSDNTCHGWIQKGDRREVVEDKYEQEEYGFASDARDVFSEFLQDHAGSLFFPTFRRIEGGFTIGTDDKPTRAPGSLLGLGRPVASDLQKAVADISRKLSNKSHKFVTSISTIDISELLLLRYTGLSEATSKFQTKTTQDIISSIKNFRSRQMTGDVNSEDSANDILYDVAAKIELIDRKREETMAPFQAITSLVARIFRHKAIQINRSISLGDAADAISSDLLSAGEKQMLSFICYNAFSREIPIFIDEPELSLHVDWQRTLFPTLETQGTSNQFIIATHSPFIYSKYPEKEITLAPSRGDEEADA